MLNLIYLQHYNTTLFDTVYQQDKEKFIQKVDQYLKNNFTFTHPWDMERCTQNTQFTGDWDMNPYGDMEWNWMLNRHRFIEELGSAYFLTHDIKYFYSFQSYICDWISKNNNPQAKLATSWRRIDAGIRVIHWLKAIGFFSSCPEFTKEFQLELYDMLRIHGKFLVDGISSTSYTSNWGVLEFYGLFALSLFFDDQADWKTLSLKVLNEALHYQVLADGVQWERSPMYHNEVCFSYLNIIFLARQHDIALSQEFLDCVQNMVLANVKWVKPNNQQPRWGDSDDTNLHDLFSLGALIFNNPVFKNFASDTLDLENYLLLGEKNALQYKHLSKQMPSFTSVNFRDTGFLVLRDSWDTTSSYHHFNTKNYGGGHGHDDLLHISYFAYHKDYLIDCGRFTYTETPERQYLKSSFGHNTIIINDIESSIYKDSWSNLTEASYITGDWIHQMIDWAFSYNTSYLAQGVLITRNLIKFNPQSFLILDIIQTDRETKVELKFNTPQPITQNTHFYLDDLCMIVDPATTNTIEESYYSPHYNQKIDSSQIRQTVHIQQTQSIANLFSFEECEIHKMELKDRKGKVISPTKAVAYHITVKDHIYVLLYKIAPSAENSGFFMEFNNKFYIHSKVLLRQESDLSFTEIIKYV